MSETQDADDRQGMTTPPLETILPGRYLGYFIARDDQRTRGFGFIREHGAKERHFVHASAFAKTAFDFETIEVGTKMSFRLRRVPTGLQAWDLKTPTVDEAATMNEEESYGNR